MPINELEISSLRSEISAVGQTTVLFNDTIFNNIKYANPNATEQEIIEASKKAYADDFITNLPEGYETKVGDDG